MIRHLVHLYRDFEWQYERAAKVIDRAFYISVMVKQSVEISSTWQEHEQEYAGWTASIKRCLGIVCALPVRSELENGLYFPSK